MEGGGSKGGWESWLGDGDSVVARRHDQEQLGAGMPVETGMVEGADRVGQ